MLDATAKKLLRLLDSEHPAELRSAAAQVLAKVGTRDGETAEALDRALDDPDQTVRLHALHAVGQLRVEPCLGKLLHRIREGGPEAEAAAQSAALLGAKATKALQDLMREVPPGLRRRIAGALGGSHTSSAATAAVDVLLDKDPGVVDAATRSLIGEVPTLTDAQKKSMADHVLEQLKPKKDRRLPPVSETALVRLLAGLGDPRGEAVFWSKIDAPGPIDLRAAALQALGAFGPPTGKDKVKRLLACAADRNFRVAAPALMLLQHVAISDRNLADWLPLFDAPDLAVRRFALDKLGERSIPDVVAALLRQIHHPDRSLRESSLDLLGKSEPGRAALGEALLEADNVDDAWSLARTQARFVKDYDDALLEKLRKQAFALLEAGDRRSDPLLFLLRERDPRALRDRLEEQAQAFRKKKAYEKALVYLRLLTRDPACAEPIRFETAACGLKLSGKDLSAESRATDLSIQQFARLVHSHDVDPLERIKATKWLDGEDLFYLGFHFAEGNAQERAFAAELLKLAIKQSPKSKLAKDAKSKLRGTGLE